MEAEAEAVKKNIGSGGITNLPLPPLPLTWIFFHAVAKLLTVFYFLANQNVYAISTLTNRSKRDLYGFEDRRTEIRKSISVFCRTLSSLRADALY